MATRKLNKKVALIGSAVFVVLVAAAIALVLYLNRDPQKFINDGDAAIQAAREVTDELIKNEKYKSAERSYHQARALAKADSLRIEITFKLADLYREIGQWRDVMGCWNEISRLDTKNHVARFGRLKYLYLMADSGFRGAWQEVASQASEFIELLEQDPESFARQTIDFDPFPTDARTSDQERLGPYAYLVRGRAMLEIARSGASTDVEDVLSKAVKDLEKVQELEPGNVTLSRFLAAAMVTQGEIYASRGEVEKKDETVKQAMDLLQRTTELAPTDPEPHISLLGVKLALALRSDVDQVEQKVLSLEPQYSTLVKEFPNSPEAFHALAGFYRMSVKNLDKAVEAGQTAVKLDKENIAYVQRTARLHYSKFCIYGDKYGLDRAIEMAKNALTLPGAQDKPGPREWAGRMNRVSFFALLAECYIEQLLADQQPLADEQRQQLLKDAEQTVLEIEHLFGIGEAPQVIKWRGLLELAQGETNSAIKKLYNAYEQLKAVDQKDSLLSYRLARFFQDTTELGAAKEFYESALRRTDREGGIDEKKPEALLDYARLLLSLGDHNTTLSIIDFFERKYWANQSSAEIRLNALIRAGQFDEVEKELAKMDQNDPNAMMLRVVLLQVRIRQEQRALAHEQMKRETPLLFEEPELDANQPPESLQVISDQLRAYWADLANLLQKLLETEPNAVRETSIVALCNHYVSDGKTAEAGALIDKFLKIFPDRPTLAFYRRMLAEPQPTQISQNRRRQLEEQALSSITDPVRRAMNLGRFYHRNHELDKAAAEFEKVIEIQDTSVTLPSGQKETSSEHRRLATSYLFEIALTSKDWELASQIAEKARLQDLDDCKGRFFAARLDVAKENYQEALANCNECLKYRPVFSQAYILRSNVYDAIGNKRMAGEDAQKAAALNPLDGTIAKALASVLFRRNQELGENVSAEQADETKRALYRAIRLNPADLQMQGFYAEFISEQNPNEALAIRQRLQRAFPSAENAVLLGKMAMRLGLREQDEQRKEALLDIAHSSFEQALNLEPQNRAALEAQAEYYRVTGQTAQGQQLLEQSQNLKLLWAYYFRDGKFEQARNVLRQLYDSDPQDANVVTGLLFVAEKNRDQEQVKRYSEELVSLEQGLDSYLLQIRSFLSTGLVKEAEYKLESFREKFPGEPRALLLEAWLAMRQGQLKKALELANKSLATDQNNPFAWRLRGQINSLMTDYEQATEDLRNSKSMLADPVTQIALAKAYLAAGRVEDAITELDSALKSPQASPSARYLLEQTYLRQGRTEALKTFYDEILAASPDNVDWHIRAAKFEMSMRRFEHAEQLYAKALQIAVGREPSTGQDTATSQSLMAQYQSALDGYFEALVQGAGSPDKPESWKLQKLNRVLAEANKHLEKKWAPMVYLRMAEAKFKLGHESVARQHCRTALDRAFAAQDPGTASTIAQRLRLLIGAEETLTYCTQRLETDPDSVAANLAMFSLAKADADYNKAIDHIDRCLAAVTPSSAQATRYVTDKVRVLELAYNKTADNSYLRKAIDEYESLLDKLPNNTNTVVLNNLAYMLASNNERLAEALEYASRAYQARPNNPGFLDTYAYVLYKNGKYAEADQYAQSSLQQYMQNDVSVPPEVYEHLGMIKEKLGAEAEALVYYEQALKIGVDTLSEPAKEAIKGAIERLSNQAPARK